MPRRSPVDVCMLCGEVPCECNKSAPKKKTSARVKAAAVPSTDAPSQSKQSDPAASPRDRMKAAAAAQRTKQVGKPAAVETVSAPSLKNDDALLHEAIRTIGRSGMLHPEDYERWSAIITAEPTVTERAQVWRERRAANAEADR